MKKTFALLMAALMTASMTTVAFAAPNNYITLDDKAYWDRDGKNGIAAGEAVYLSSASDEKLNGGETLYIPVFVADGSGVATGLATTKAHVAGWDIAFVKDEGVFSGKISTPEFKQVTIDGTKRMAVAFKVAENNTLDVKELSGAFGIGETISKAKANAQFGMNLEYGPKVVDFAAYDATSSIVDFDDEEGEVDIDFGHYAVFTVDVTTQKKVDLRFDDDYNEDFNENYEYANCEFLNFHGNPIFNRNGEMVIFADEDQYLYEVTKDNTAKEVKGAEYDEDLGGYVFKTRTLKSYVLSDEELDVDDEIADGEIVVEKPEAGDNAGKPNPDTGR